MLWGDPDEGESMTESLKIKESIKKRLERFWSSSEERGGFLIANRRGVVCEFLPLPNMSSVPKERYQEPQSLSRILDFAYDYSKSKYRYGFYPRVVAFFHTHPTPCIMSAADLSCAPQYRNLLFVTISPIEREYWCKEFAWYACSGIEPRRIEFV
jgi:proteasome lid subunit RPN8/RPN11